MPVKMRGTGRIQIKQDIKISSAAERDEWAEDFLTLGRMHFGELSGQKQSRSSSIADSGASPLSVPSESAGQLSKAQITGLQLPLHF